MFREFRGLGFRKFIGFIGSELLFISPSASWFINPNAEGEINPGFWAINRLALKARQINYTIAPILLLFHISTVDPKTLLPDQSRHFGS